MGSYVECVVDGDFTPNPYGETRAGDVSRGATDDGRVSFTREDVIDYRFTALPPFETVPDGGCGALPDGVPCVDSFDNGRSNQLAWCWNGNKLYCARNIALEWGWPPVDTDASTQARNLSHSLFPDDTDKRNAFLHAAWIGLVAFDVGPDAARALGVAPEKDIGKGVLDTQVDLINNDLGIAIAAPASSKFELIYEVFRAANEGSLLVRRLNSGVV